MKETSRAGALAVIIGPDGSGKSSISNMVVEKLSPTFPQIRYVWCRFESKLLGFLLRVNSKVAGFEGDFRESYEARSESKNRLLTNSPLRWPYLAFVVISYMMDLRKKVVRPLRAGYLIVSDRYVYDTIVDLWVDFGKKDKSLVFLTPMLINIAPPPKYVFWVDVPEEISMSRKNDVPNIEYVAMRRKGYELLSRRISTIRLDGTQPIEANADRICDVIRGFQY